MLEGEIDLTLPLLRVHGRGATGLGTGQRFIGLLHCAQRRFGHAVNVRPAFVETDALRNFGDQECHPVPQGAYVHRGVELPQNGMCKGAVFELGHVSQIAKNMFDQVCFGVVLDGISIGPCVNITSRESVSFQLLMRAVRSRAG